MPIALTAVQVALPITLVAWLALLPPHSLVGLTAQAAAMGALLVALALAGLWLFPPWWTPHACGGLYAASLVAAIARRRGAPLLPAAAGGWVLAAAFVALGLWAGLEVARALQGRAPPPGPAVDLAFPLRGGEYLVVNGGTYLGINAHVDALDQTVPARRAWRGTAYGIDLVKLGWLGTTAAGIAPAGPAAHHVFGEPVLAPCAGPIERAVDSLPDMKVSEADKAHPAGKHVVLRCGRVNVVLAHFRRGSVRVVDE